MTQARIIDDQPLFIVLDKPSGLLVHPDGKSIRPTLTQWLVDRYPSIALVGEDPTRPGIVQRLDREASGVMIVAKTPGAFDSLKRQFQHHTILKEYTILVHGSIPRDEGTIAFPLGRSRRTGRITALPHPDQGKQAVTHFSVIARRQRYTLLQVTTDTGRTHQIRTHFFAYNHPLVGDTLYRNTRIKDDCPRLFLHASRLGLRHPTTQEWMEYQSPLPNELETYLKEKHILPSTTNH